MPDKNVLLERDFVIDKGGVKYQVRARAVFAASGPMEDGTYHIHFRFRTHEEDWRPDDREYSREKARRAAEALFDSGRVEAYAGGNIQTWINTGG